MEWRRQHAIGVLMVVVMHLTSWLLLRLRW